jgi:hypothetical protein
MSAPCSEYDCVDAQEYGEREGGKPQVQLGIKRNLSCTGCDLAIDSMQPESTALKTKRFRLLNEALPAKQKTGTLPEEEDICDQCLELNLGALMRALADPNRTEKDYPVPWMSTGQGSHLIAEVGYRYKQSLSSSCMLCRILIACRMEMLENHAAKTSGKQHDCERLYAMSSVDRTHLRKKRSFQPEGLNIVLVSGAVSDCTNNDIVRHIKSKGCAVIVSDTQPILFTPKPIPRQFDALSVRSWLSFCIKNHGLLCAPRKVSVRDLEVIDCSTMMVERHNGKSPYVTLSYVWSTENGVCGPVQKRGGVKALPALLSAVIKDSIQVTKALGYRFLWVDKFCIDQDASDLKHDQIRQMDAIYSNSELTIISAAGVDETYGLPGVSARSRSRQLIAKLHGATVFLTSRDPHNVILQSHWSTRGWTFQEAILGRRRLVFTDDQVYFQCQTMNCFESVHHPLEDIHLKDKSKTYRWLRAGILGRDRGRIFGNFDRRSQSLNGINSQYLSNVESYTARNLRFDEDSLNAFRGIIRQSLNGINSQYLSNVESYTARNLRFDEDSLNAFRGIIRQSPLPNVWGLAYTSNFIQGSQIFAHSLMWMHTDDSKRQRRRILFPSWTWVGWEGRVVYDLATSSALWSDSSLKDVRFQTSDGDSIRFIDLVNSRTRIDERQYLTLQVTATVIPHTLIVYQPAKKSSSPWLILKHQHRATLSWSAEPRTEAELANLFHDTSRFQFIYIGSILGASFVMVLEALTGRHTWQRVGIFRVTAYAYTFEDLRMNEMRTFDIE